MANIVSYVDIIELMTSIAQRHYQINTFFLGRDWEVENNEDVLYPLFQVYPEFAKMPINDWNEYKTLELTLNCKVLDITTPGEENEKDVHSDTLRIAQDIVNELNQHPFYIRSNVSLMEDISFNALEEHKDDITAGWSFSLKLKIINANTFCGMPIAELPGYSANGPTSSGTIVNTQYLTCDTLPDCPTIIDIDLTLQDLQDQIDNLPPSALTLSQVLGYGNSTGNQIITAGTNLSNILQVSDTVMGLSWNGVVGGNITLDDTFATIYHDTLTQIESQGIVKLLATSRIDIESSVIRSTLDDGFNITRLTFDKNQTVSDTSTNNNLVILDNISNKGIVYFDDYSANFTNRSLVDKAYVDALTPAAPSLSSVLVVGNTTGNNDIIIDNSGPRYIKSSIGNLKVYFGDDNILMLQNGNILDTERAQTEYSTNNIISTVLGNGLLDSSIITQLYNSITFATPYFEFTADNGGYNQGWISGGNAAMGFGYGNNNIWIDATKTQVNGNFNAATVNGTVTTTIYQDGSQSAFNITDSSTGESEIILAEQGSGVSLQVNNGTVTNQFVMSLAGFAVPNNGSDNSLVIYDYINTKGLVYQGDYSANFTDESLVSKRYTTSTFLSISSAGSTYVPYTGATTNVDLGANNFTVTGSITSGMTGSASRVVEAGAGGGLTATKDIIDSFLTAGSAPALLLINVANWNILGVYIGTAITGTYQGQEFYNANYYFRAVNDNDWIRMARS